MPKKVYLYPYKAASESCKLLGYTRIKLHNSRFRPNAERKLVVNWGHGSCPYTCLNKHARKASNKVDAFSLFAANSVSIPRFTVSKPLAQSWEKKIVVRHITSASEGRGIEIVEAGQPLPDAPLYVEYIKKSKEFRVHVFNGEVIDVQQKVLKATAPRENTNFAVRNTANGFIFQRNGITVPNMVRDEAIKAVQALGLDFGGVDVIWNEHYQRAYVLEVNTAPGIEGSTVLKYQEAINRYATHGQT